MVELVILVDYEKSLAKLMPRDRAVNYRAVLALPVIEQEES